MADLTDDALIFVYGTLRPGGSAEARMAGRGRWLGPAHARGLLYRIAGYPGLADGEGRVRGDLFQADDPFALLCELDAYEGCGPDDAQPAEYRRARIAIECDGQSRTAWAYLYNWPVESAALIASGDFLDDVRNRS